MTARARAWILVLTVLTLLPETGCVRRRLNVRTNPPGAVVYVDNQQIGTSPCSVDFTYYGTREIRMVKPGYETLTVNQPIPMPWYQVPPIDFVSENLVPNQIRDNRTVTFDLAPQIVVPTEQLLDRASQLRQETVQFPTSPAAGPPTVIGAPVVGPPVTIGQPTTAPVVGPPVVGPPTMLPPPTTTQPTFPPVDSPYGSPAP